jgi:rhomboid protease GluP
MAVGFTPSYNENINTKDLTAKESVVLLIETIKKLNWEVSYMSINGIIAYTNQGLFSWNAEIKITIEEDAIHVTSSSTGNEMYDWGKNKKSVENFIQQFHELKTEIATEELAEKFTAIEENLVAVENDIFTLPPPTTIENIKGFFSIFIPVEGYFITPLLININILVFIIMVISGVDIMAPTSENLLTWGANFRPVTLGGAWWRLLTNCFLHIGLIHLLMNMYALMFIGLLLEPLLGRIRFLSAYILAGLLASVTSLWWHDLTISAGASGAIFGMYGLFLALLTTDLIEKNARKALLASIAIFVGYNLINGLKGGIDNAAHIGGLLGGVIIGYAYTFSLDEEDNQRLKLKVIGSLTVAFSIISFIICSGLTNDIVIYEAKMKDFNEMEKMALEIYGQASYYPKEDLLYNIKDRGIYYWNENINLINEVDKLSLPEEIHRRNSRIKTYCELRIKSFELLYKAVSENTDKYKVEIQNYDRQIQSLINELSQK